VYLVAPFLRLLVFVRVRVAGVIQLDAENDEDGLFGTRVRGRRR
jgi:hypothetical protein